MYDAVSDPYCYPDTTVLINKLDLRDQERLDAFEAEVTSQRAAEPLPTGRLDAGHYCAIHAHLFQDITHGLVKFVPCASQRTAACLLS